MASAQKLKLKYMIEKKSKLNEPSGKREILYGMVVLQCPLCVITSKLMSHSADDFAD